MMRKKISFLLLLISLNIFSQSTEIVILGGTQDNNPIINNVLSDAISTLNGDGTITIKGDIILKNNFTIPKDIDLNFFKGNKIIIENGIELSIKGSIKAGIYQIFAGNGKVIGKPLVNNVYPEWFGAKIDDNIDDLNAIQNAINISNGKVNLVTGEYILKNALNVENCILNLNRAKLKFKFDEKYECLRMKSNSSVENGIIEFSGINQDPFPNTISGNIKSPIVIGDYPKGIGYHNVILQNLTIITNRKNGNGITITGESSEITIKNIYFPDSQYLGRGILAHWGGSDSVSTNSPETYHPHNISIDNVRFGVMSLDDPSIKDASGIFVAGAYNVTVSNIQIKEAFWFHGMIRVFVGDHGNLYTADDKIKTLINEGVIFDNCNIESAHFNAVSIDCIPSKNNTRDLILKGPILKNIVAKASLNNKGVGISVNNNLGSLIENCKMDGFDYGLSTGENVSNLIIRGGEYINSDYNGINIHNGSTTELPPMDCIIEKVQAYHNGRNTSSARSGIYVGNSYRTKLFENVIGKENETQTYGIRVDDMKGFTYQTARNTILENNHVSYSTISAYSIGRSNYIGSDSNSFILVSRFKGNSASKNSGIFQSGITPMIIDTHILPNIVPVTGNPNPRRVVREFIGKNIPSIGEWNIGDKIYNDFTNFSSFNGYICIESGVGSAAKWRAF